MPVRKIVSHLRESRKKRENEAAHRAEALKQFFDRLDRAFPEVERFDGNQITQERAEVARQRRATRRASCDWFSDNLRKMGVDPRVLASISEQSEKDRAAFARWWIGELARKGETMLDQVTPTDTLPKVLVVTRDFLADDIASDVFVRDIVRAVTEKVFISPAKRA